MEGDGQQRSRIRAFLRPKRAVAFGVLLFLLVPAATTSLRSQHVRQALRLTGARTPAAQGGHAPVSKATAGIAHKTGRSRGGPSSKPRLLRLTRAHGKVFDVRRLKSHVVKRERPEREGIDPMPSTVSQGTIKRVTHASRAFAAAAPGPDSSFDGLDFANWGQGHPPDTNGDVGPNYYIQTINVSIGIYAKSTGNRVAAFTFNSFMSQGHFGNLCDTDNFGDPVVLYDSYEDRWFITDFAFKLDGSGNVNPQTVYQCFAVSKTGNPVNGGWNYYSVLAPGGLADYPKFGVWPDGIYMSANMFGYSAAGSYFGYHAWALNKQQMYDGAPSVQVVDFAGDTSDFTVIPANSRLQDGSPPAGSPEYFVSTEQFLNALSIYKFHVDWDKPSTSTFTGPTTQTAPTCWPNSAVANASTPANAADTLSIRAMAQAQYSNIGGAESLWVDHTVNRGEFPIASCGGTNSNNATIRWYQANVTGGTIAANLTQGATFDPDGANTFFRFMPSLAVDRTGNMAMDYTKSNATTNPQIKYAGRLAGDPVNTLPQSEQTLINGTGAQSGNCGASACTRWGDYSGMALDPNGCEFWTTGMYFATTGLNYLTRIGSFHYPSCTTVGNGTLQGTVTDGSSPIAGATVSLGSRTTTTDGSGSYSFTVPAGTYPTETAAKTGYNAASTSTIVVADGGAATRNFTLSAATQSGCFTDNTQTAFQRGTPTNCSLTASPGNVVLASPDNTAAQNNSVSPSGFGFNNTSWAGQTFTPAVTGRLNRVDVELFCSACSGVNPNITVSIRNTTGATPVPTGADLATATLAGFNDGGAGGLKTVTFSSPITVTAGTRYAFIFRSVSARTAGTYAYTCSCVTTGFSNTNPYGSGQFVTSSNSGSTWSADTTVGGRDLNFVTYINPGFASSGTLVSALKDANPAPGSSPTWTTLSFSATTPASTAVKFQVAASNSQYGPFDFVGPDGTAGTFFTTSGASLAQFNGFRYLRYEAILTTGDPAVTPSLSSVQVCFNDQANTTATSLTVAAASGMFGGTANLRATLTLGGSPVSGESVAFTLNGASAGSATTDASGVATLNGAGLAGINAGSYPSGVGASFAGDVGLSASSGTGSLTVSPASQAIVVTTHAPAAAAVGGGFTVAATGGGSANPVTFSSSGACTNVGALFTMAGGAGTCTVKYDQAGNGNYNAAPTVTETTSVVDAAVTISAGGTDRVNGSRVFTGHVDVNGGSGVTNAPAGTQISFSLDSGPGGFTTATPCSTVGATGSCSITLTAALTGTTKLSAHTDVSVTGVSVHRNSTQATETWVDARISIGPDATNAVNAPHTFTVTVQKDVGDGNGFVAAAGEHAAYTLTNSNGAAHSAETGTCTNAGANTDAAGQCTLSFSSPSAGRVTGHASATVTVVGLPIGVATDGTAANSIDAVKTFVDANVQVTPLTSTSAVGASPAMSAHVNVNDGSGAPANAPNGTLITFSLTNTAGATATFVGPSSCTTTGGTGSCTVTISSPTVGTTTVHASVTPSVGGVSLSRATGDGNTGDGADATKTWGDATPPVTTITLSPANPDVNGWYVFAIKASVSAVDTSPGTGVSDTRCQLDTPVPPANGDYSDLQPGCRYLAPTWVRTEGIHTLYAASIDNAGNKEPIQKIVFKIDETAPTAQVTALSQFQGAATFPVAWSGTDNLSGVANYDVRYRQAPSNGTFGSYTTWFTGTTSTGASFTAAAGSTTCFSVRATDVAGWTTAAWSAERCTTVPLDDPALGRVGSWSTVAGTGYYGPGVARSGGVGSELTQSMRGQTIGVLVTKQPGGGTIQLRWNGATMLTQSLSAAGVQTQQLLTFTLKSVKAGTLEIVQTGPGTVDIDGAGAYKTS